MSVYREVTVSLFYKERLKSGVYEDGTLRKLRVSNLPKPFLFFLYQNGYKERSIWEIVIIEDKIHQVSD